MSKILANKQKNQKKKRNDDNPKITAGHETNGAENDKLRNYIISVIGDTIFPLFIIRNKHEKKNTKLWQFRKRTRRVEKIYI